MENFIKEKFIQVVALVPVPLHDLIINAACAYFNLSREDLLCKSPDYEHARKKRLVYLLLKQEVQMSPPAIAIICNTSRQNIDKATDKMEAEVNIYLQSGCDYRNIKKLFEDLQKAQNECLTLHGSSTKP